MAVVWEQNVIVTSYNVISRGCGPQWKHFWTYYLSFKFRCHSFNILVVKRWGRNPPPSPPLVPQDQKKPSLNRLNDTRTSDITSPDPKWTRTGDISKPSHRALACCHGNNANNFDLAPNLIPVHCITPFCSDALVSSPKLFPPCSHHPPFAPKPALGSALESCGGRRRFTANTHRMGCIPDPRTCVHVAVSHARSLFDTDKVIARNISGFLYKNRAEDSTQKGSRHGFY